MRTRFVALALGGLVVVLAVAAVALGFFSGGDSTVEIAAFQYNGGEPITTTSGATLTLVNEDPVSHTFSLRDTPLTRTVRGFGNESDLVIDVEPGTYEIYCQVLGHGNMEGTLVVE